MGDPGSIYSPFLTFFGDVGKSLFFEVVPRHVKIQKNRAMGRPRVAKGTSGVRPGGRSMAPLPPRGSRATVKTIKSGIAEQKAMI